MKINCFIKIYIFRFDEYTQVLVFIFWPVPTQGPSAPPQVSPTDKNNPHLYPTLPVAWISHEKISHRCGEIGISKEAQQIQIWSCNLLPHIYNKSQVTVLKFTVFTCKDYFFTLWTWIRWWMSPQWIIF